MISTESVCIFMPPVTVGVADKPIRDLIHILMIFDVQSVFWGDEPPMTILYILCSGEVKPSVNVQDGYSILRACE